MKEPIRSTIRTNSPSRVSTRIIRSPSVTRKYNLSPKITYSRPRLVSERVVQSPVKVSNGVCPCKTHKIEYQESILEKKQCPLCNSVLIKKVLSPIRRSVQSNISHFGNIQKSSHEIQKFTIPENEYQLVDKKVYVYSY